MRGCTINYDLAIVLTVRLFQYAADEPLNSPAMKAALSRRLFLYLRFASEALRFQGGSSNPMTYAHKVIMRTLNRLSLLGLLVTTPAPDLIN